ncbi:MAG TPA: DUF951 domain-containing protein [Bacilli bacterium]|jgi:hypothetical protein|nr:DUF951 domain-containing protein [Bacilli bacterium]NLT01841.1 DUF951 domain-containing protein [Acholeplasmataceae bacterium]HNZ77323.1 DUF951 domain-containing protein [Bacilli bacterium]HOD60666.1 DUF951 domain-containing protein [Bacilli bacterium]HOE06290.1 DUF951 domain-containing protein [Bacilli bacterium]
MTIIKTDYADGDILEFKKPHPCGGKTWKIIRAGVDCKLECETCKRVVIIPRIELNKKTKKIINSRTQS